MLNLVLRRVMARPYKVYLHYILIQLVQGTAVQQPVRHTATRIVPSLLITIPGCSVGQHILILGNRSVSKYI
jgi:hypothetical protein